MIKKTTTVAAVLSLAAGMGACTGMSHEDTGVVTGGIIGGVVGSQFGSGGGRAAGAVVGAIAGSMIGGAIGRDMDARDHERFMNALESSPTGRHVTWHNADSGYYYDVVTTKTYYRVHSGDRQPCREYVTKARIGGKVRQIYGKACRTPDGSWRVIK